MKVKNKKIKSVSELGFPKPKKVNCSKCGKEFFVKFVISRLSYSQKNNWGYWCEDESKRDQEWCNDCLREIYQNKETYWKAVQSSKKRLLFRVYLHSGRV